MDFDFTEDEQQLVEGIRRLCAGRFSMNRVRQGEGRRALDIDGWAALAAAGVFSLRLTGEEGAGLGMAAAALVFEQLGRALVPGPLAGTEAAAGVVKGAASGESPVGILRRPVGPRPPVVVGDLGSLGAVLVVDVQGLWRLEPDSLEAQEIDQPLDPLTPLWRVQHIPLGERLGDAVLAGRVWCDHLVLCAALLAGMASATCDLAADYAKVRRQFDRPIGSFQAVKHMCADMLVRAETARVGVHAAAVTIDQPDVGDVRRAGAGAVLLAAEAALTNAKTCIQVHGGTGFTWEVPAHLYLKRAVVLSQLLEPADVWADTVAERF
ncbi:MAG TPA: acyl-CoA dehydrogenase family protein [Acidimicrobiales bacterium]|nr:acyl-CoA dehydrogenase family protein [Acidimicrobiales bacterium]